MHGMRTCCSEVSVTLVSEDRTAPASTLAPSCCSDSGTGLSAIRSSNPRRVSEQTTDSRTNPAFASAPASAAASTSVSTPAPGSPTSSQALVRAPLAGCMRHASASAPAVSPLSSSSCSSSLPLSCRTSRSERDACSSRAAACSAAASSGCAPCRGPTRTREHCTPAMAWGTSQSTSLAISAPAAPPAAKSRSSLSRSPAAAPRRTSTTPASTLRYLPRSPSCGRRRGGGRAPPACTSTSISISTSLRY